MKYAYVLSEEAVVDIDHIFEFGVHKFGNAQALKYLLELEKHLEQLSSNSDMDRERKEIKKGLYSLPFVSHIIFYRKLKGKLRMVRILYGGRDLIRFLD